MKTEVCRIENNAPVSLFISFIQSFKSIYKDGNEHSYDNKSTVLSLFFEYQMDVRYFLKAFMTSTIFARLRSNFAGSLSVQRQLCCSCVL